MRIQFSVTPQEYAKLQQKAAAKGYPNVPSYCKDAALEDRTFATLWLEVKERIEKMPAGTRFALRDIIESPPANLGVVLYNSQTELGIKVDPKKDSLNTNVFTKL